MTLRLTSITLAAALFCGTLPAAVQPNANEAKLREGLRNSMLQLHTMQGERDALQVAKTQLEQEKKALADQVTALTKRVAEDKELADKSIADLKAKVESQSDRSPRSTRR